MVTFPGKQLHINATTTQVRQACSVHRGAAPMVRADTERSHKQAAPAPEAGRRGRGLDRPVIWAL